MNKNSQYNDCADFSIEINSEVFDKDFDEVEFEPVSIDDSDEESANLFGY